MCSVNSVTSGLRKWRGMPSAEQGQVISEEQHSCQLWTCWSMLLTLGAHGNSPPSSSSPCSVSCILCSFSWILLSLLLLKHKQQKREGVFIPPHCQSNKTKKSWCKINVVKTCMASLLIAKDLKVHFEGSFFPRSFSCGRWTVSPAVP